MIKQHVLCQHCPKNPVNYLKAYNIPMSSCYFYHHLQMRTLRHREVNWLKTIQSISAELG